ncbi:MAG: hypothetical protein M4D80_15735 [Myxococcota bacterium]|nr:hypothetical protein [Deltaproteobacteria bacterium]MDQ3336618.1 hypothetical protein [Myxococcota bacterium]
MRWLAVLVLVSCYSPRAFESCITSCAATGVCPSGLECFANLCRVDEAEVCPPRDAIDPFSDRDMDGIFDISDLCPDLYHLDNRDHDLDQVGDKCDPCPHLSKTDPSAPDADGDGDGVGNGCDPRVTVQGDTQARFVGFYDANDVVGWSTVGTWQIGSGIATASALAHNNAYLESPTQLGANVAITAAITIREVNTAMLHYGGVAVRRSGQNTQGCQLIDGGAAMVRYRVVENTMDLDSDTPFTGPVLNVSRVYRHLVQGNAGDCNVDGTVETRLNAPNRDGRVAIEAGYVTMDVDYVFVVKMPP